jgi:hypothetical protein
MSYLKKIVGFINQELQANLLNDSCYSNSKIIGLCQVLPRQKGERLELLPSYVDNDGEAQYVGPDDDYDLIIYHRLNRIAVSKANLKSFGDTRQLDANSAQMSLVVFGLRNKLKLSNDELAVRIQANFPQAATKALLTEMTFQACNININDIILNDLQVFQEEFQNIGFFLKPDQFLFKVNYTIESAFLKECFKTCNCTN